MPFTKHQVYADAEWTAIILCRSKSDIPYMGGDVYVSFLGVRAIVMHTDRVADPGHSQIW